MAEINARFKAVRKKCGLTQAEFGKVLGLSASGVSDIEAGRRNVTEQHIIMLNHWDSYRINTDWLRTGEGEMFLPGPKSVLEEVSEKLNLNEFETAFMKVYLRLPKQVRDNFCNGLYDELFKIKQPDAEPTESRLLQEEAEAVKKDGEKCSASPPSKEA